MSPPPESRTGDGRDAVERPVESKAPSTIAPGPRGSFLHRYGVKGLISIAITLVFVWILRKANFRLYPSHEAWAKVRWGWISIHVCLLMALHFIRAARWRHLLRPIEPTVGLRRIVAASWIGFCAILLLPLRSGEIFRPYLLRDGKKLTLGATLGATGAERVIDGLAVTLVLAGALLFVPHLEPLPASVGALKIPVATIPRGGFFALGIFVCAFTAMFLFYFKHDLAIRLVRATIGRIHKGLGEKIVKVAEGLAGGLHFLAAGHHAFGFILETAIYWGLNAVLMWTLGIACGLPFTFGQACSVMGVLAVGILVPAGPGFAGPFQAAVVGSLAMYYPAFIAVDREGSAYVFLLFVIQFIWHLVAAGIAAAIDPKMLRRASATATRAEGT